MDARDKFRRLLDLLRRHYAGEKVTIPRELSPNEPPSKEMIEKANFAAKPIFDMESMRWLCPDCHEPIAGAAEERRDGTIVDRRLTSHCKFTCKPSRWGGW